MKKKGLFIALALCMALAVSIVVLERSIEPKGVDTLTSVETLSQGEATITCDSGNYGLCHKMSYDSYLWGLCIYYYCEWTGRQADDCPFSVYLLNNN